MNETAVRARWGVALLLAGAMAGSAPWWPLLLRQLGPATLLAMPVGPQDPARGLLWVVLGLWVLAIVPLWTLPRLGAWVGEPAPLRWRAILLPGAIAGWLALQAALMGHWFALVGAPLALLAFGGLGRAAVGSSGRPLLSVGWALGWRFTAMAVPLTVGLTGWGVVVALAATLPPFAAAEALGSGTRGLAMVSMATALLPMAVGAVSAAAITIALVPAHVAQRAQAAGAL